MKWVEEASHIGPVGQRGGGRSPAEGSEGKVGCMVMLHRELHRFHQAVASEARKDLLRLCCSSCAQDRLVRRSGGGERQLAYILWDLRRSVTRRRALG